MQKITFEDYPSTNTPVNATNLNAIQTNVENEFTSVEDDLTNVESDVNSLNNLRVYSTTETEIGTWIDGKKVYRKVFNVGNIQATTVTINHGISNLYWVINAYGCAKTGNSWYQLSRVSTEACNQQIAIVVSGSQLLVIGGSDANFNQGCYVVVEYVKSS